MSSKMHFIFSGPKLTGLNHHTIAVHYNSARRAAGEQLTPPWRWLDNSGLGKNSTDWRHPIWSPAANQCSCHIIDTARQ